MTPKTRTQIKRELRSAHFEILSSRYPGASVAWRNFHARKKTDVQMASNREAVEEAITGKVLLANENP